MSAFIGGGPTPVSILAIPSTSARRARTQPYRKRVVFNPSKFGLFPAFGGVFYSLLQVPTLVSYSFSPTPPPTPDPMPEDDFVPGLTPQVTAGPTGKCPYRPWVHAVVDGIPCYANGYDQPWRWDEGSNAYNLGSAAPTDFLTSTVVATNNWLANGASATYYLVRAVSGTGKESIGQLTAGVAGVTVENSAGAARAVKIDWTSDTTGEFNVRRIYRRLSGSDTYKLVAEVAEATATYTDDTTNTTLLTATTYVHTYRATLPPIFRVLVNYLNRLWGFTGDDATGYYAQQARTDGRFVADDWPDANLFPFDPNGPGGAVRMAWVHDAFMYVFKESAIGQLAGDDPSNFVYRGMFTGRGCLGPRSFFEIDDGKLVVLDVQGLYGWTPGGDPVVLGEARGTGVSKLAPIFRRMNIGAANSFWVEHDEANSNLIFWVAIDHEPTPNYPIVYDYKRDRFLVDPGMWGTAGGIAEDALGVRHRLRVCDRGILWEDGIGNADGVFAGTLAATLTTATSSLWTASAAAFDTTTKSGCLGSYVARVSADGIIVDDNRVAAIAATTITPLYFSEVTAVVGDVVAPGAIPAYAQSGRLGFGTAQMKHILGATLLHDVEDVSGHTIAFVTAADDDNLLPPPNDVEIDLSENDGHCPLAVSDRGWDWTWAIAQLYAGQNFTIQELELRVDVLGATR